MGTTRKSASADAFGFSNRVYLTDDISTSYYRVENHGKWSGNLSFADASDHYTGSAWSINAGNGRDLIDASQSAGENTLSGGNGVDTLIGGSGNDRLNGNNGDDTLTGNGGNDVFVLSNGDDVINDFQLVGWRTEALRMIGFEELIGGSGPHGIVPAAYADLTWSGTGAVSTSEWAGNPGIQAVATGSAVAYNLDGGAMSFASANPVDDFDFVGADFAALLFDQRVYVRVYDDGMEVGTIEFDAHTDTKTHVDVDERIVTTPDHGVIGSLFSGRFRDIDKVVIESAAGAPVVVDELALRTTTFGFEVVDRIDVPDDVDIARYVASAADDGHGNTVLTTCDNSLTLIGVSASAVSADWFI